MRGSERLVFLVPIIFTLLSALCSLLAVSSICASVVASKVVLVGAEGQVRDLDLGHESKSLLTPRVHDRQ